MTAFRDRVLAALRQNETSADAFVFGLVTDRALPNGDTADATYWDAEDQLQILLIISEEGLTSAVAERAEALDIGYEAQNPDSAGLVCGAVAIPGNWMQDDPQVDGFGVSLTFGAPEFSIYTVWREDAP